MVSYFHMFVQVNERENRYISQLYPHIVMVMTLHKNDAVRRVGLMKKNDVLLQIEQLRQELNDRYKEQSTITPELVELSVQLDHLLNKLHLRT